MAETAIQLMNTSAQVASDAFNRIDRAMTQSIEANQRGGEFAVSMTAKAADAAEKARMNDAAIANMQQEQYIRGEQFAFEQAMRPLEIQTKMLALKAAQQRLQQENVAARKQYSDQLFGTYNELMSRDILEVQNPDMAKEYLDWRGQWEAHVMNGGAVDDAKFRDGMIKIKDKYKSIGPVKRDWNAEDAYMYESVSPSLRKAYELQNPIVQRNRNGLAVGTLSSTNGDFGEFFSRYGTLYTNEEAGLIGAGRNRFQTNQNAIEIAARENLRLHSELSGNFVTEEAKRFNVDRIARNDKIIADSQKENDLIMQNYTQGKFGIPDFTEEGKTDEQKTTEQQRKDAKEKLSEAGNEPPMRIMGFAKKSESDLEGQEILNRLAVVQNEAVFETDKGTRSYVDDVDVKWFADNRIDGQADDNTKQDLVNRIEGKIDAYGNLGEMLKPEKVDKLFKIFRSTNVGIPIDDYTYSMVMYGKSAVDESGKFESGTPYYGYGSSQKQQSYLTYGKSGMFKSFDDIIKKTSKIKNMHEREQAIKSIYAGLLAASVAESVNTK